MASFYSIIRGGLVTRRQTVCLLMPILGFLPLNNKTPSRSRTVTSTAGFLSLRNLAASMARSLLRSFDRDLPACAGSITNEAVDELGLRAGGQATAVIKASDVMVAID